MRLHGASGPLRPTVWLVSAVLCIVLFATDLTGVESGFTTAPDRSLSVSLHTTFGPGSYDFFEAVSTRGGGAVRVALVALTVLALALKRFWWSAALTILVTGGVALLETLVKLGVGRPRPHLFPPAMHAGGSSFPSGHAANPGTFALVLIYLLWHISEHKGLTLAGAAVLIAFTVLVGLSRVVLGVHYPTNVLGGYALAGAWFAAVLALFAPALSEEAVRAFLRRHELLDG